MHGINNIKYLFNFVTNKKVGLIVATPKRQRSMLRRTQKYTNACRLPVELNKLVRYLYALVEIFSVDVVSNSTAPTRRQDRHRAHVGNGATATADRSQSPDVIIHQTATTETTPYDSPRTLQFSDAKDLGEIPTQSPLTGTTNKCG